MVKNRDQLNVGHKEILTRVTLWFSVDIKSTTVVYLSHMVFSSNVLTSMTITVMHLMPFYHVNHLCKHGLENRKFDSLSVNHTHSL